MNSTLTLYYNSNILPDRNFKIDSLSTYLSGLSKTTISNFQYIKHNLELTIKKDMSQENLDYLEADNIDYISIQNGTEKVVYYFVINKKWKAQKTIEFELYMDSVNTFNGDYTLSEKTKVLREHKDRWLKTEDISTEVITGTITGTLEDGVYSGSTIVTFENAEFSDYDLDIEFDTISQSVTFIGLGQARVSVSWSEEVEPEATISFTLTIYPSYIFKAKPLIDYYNEQINPLLYKKNENVIYDDYRNWYLLYKNPTYEDIKPDASKPIKVYLIPSEIIKIAYYTSFKLFDDIPYTAGKIYLMSPLYNSTNVLIKASVTLDGVTYTEYRQPRIEYQNGKQLLYTYYVGTTFIERIYDMEDMSLYRAKRVGVFTDYEILFNGDKFYYNEVDSVNDYDEEAHLYYSNTPSYKLLKCIDDIDRTDAKNIKLIEYPYCPINIHEHESVGEGIFYTFDEDLDFTYSNGLLEIENFLGTNMEREIESNIANPLKPLFERKFINGFDTMDRNDNYETKLYHSQFYSPKFAYDSFGYNFDLEREDYPNEEQDFKFKMISSISTNSRMIFEMIQEKLKLITQDYPSILTIARNNESLLLNSAYLNYLRVGYNYDVKNKQLIWDKTMLDIALKGVTSGLTSAVGFATGNVVVGTGALLSGGTSILSSITSAVKQTESAELSIQQKLQTTMNQAVNVASSEDLYIMKYYTKGNKAKLMTYQISDRLKDLVSDLFYYCGYATQEYKIPEENTRMYFNFIQAELVFASSKNISEDILLDIKRRYGEGVTILHHYNNTWDFNQVKENFERSLID